MGIQLRNRLAETFGGPDFKTGVILPFLFSIFYLQYKINELIDNDATGNAAMPDRINRLANGNMDKLQDPSMLIRR